MEQTQFFNENADLFTGEQGKKLYEAFKAGNYNIIQQELENNDVLTEIVDKRRQELQILLDIEEARQGDSRNEANIAYLKEQLALLNDTNQVYRANLKLRLEQEQSQLDIYKEYLEKQQEALEDSLNKRKDAYSKYFETVNQAAEDEDYEEKATLLISNLSKLAASDSADSKTQAAELEQQLKDLEKERLQELRERAQEAVLNNIETQLDEISEKFDKLLENNQALLELMRDQITQNAKSFVSDLLQSGTKNMTALEMEDYLNTFKTSFASILPAGALDNVSIQESNNETLILNVAGKEIEIGDSTQQDLYSAIMKAMKQLGIK